MPVFANVRVYLRREIKEQEVKETTVDGSLDVVIARESGGLGDNPWRVAQMKANVIKEVKYNEFWADLG